MKARGDSGHFDDEGGAVTARAIKVRLHTGTAKIVHLSTFEKNHPSSTP